ncbi:hypothetical protein [Herbaspirillum autotrophicum]|uniref:hypothetical protein n=1 Tax=Herbaspirillum autotrophicum TaxID=180195 RepID=UPI000A7C54D7|nr:hypothetical protein [Herbaspirillum autotrophicum]
MADLQQTMKLSLQRRSWLFHRTVNQFTANALFMFVSPRIDNVIASIAAHT